MFGFDTKVVAFAVGASALLAATAYVLWGPSQSQNGKAKIRNKKGLVPGLTNFGNSCFLNAILQSLASCGSMVEWLASSEQCDRHISSHFSGIIRRVLKVLNNESVEYHEEYCPSDVIEALRDKNWIISSDEQDCHELFHVLTETLDEESVKYPSVVSLFDVKSIQSSPDIRYNQRAYQRYGLSSPRLPHKQEYPFRGLLSSQLQCKTCGHKNPIKYDLFDSLSLTIPAKFMGTLSIAALLRHFVQPECVNEVECDQCTKMTVSNGVNSRSSKHAKKTTFTKKLTLGKLPQCLCIQIQRTNWLDNGMPVKRFEHIYFPEVLDMDPFVYQAKKRPTSLTGLTGGRQTNVDPICSPPKCPPIQSPLSAPYSHPIRLLKAANHHQRATLPGIESTGIGKCNALESTDTTPTISSHTPELTSPIQDTRVQQLAAFYSNDGKKKDMNQYRLVSAIVHVGDVYAGHFITYRRAPMKSNSASMGSKYSKQWLYASDSFVRKATEDEVFGSTAYMLFYEKI